MSDQIFGIMAEFKTPGELLEAARRVYAEGFRQFDTHSPFPVHGMDAAMGLTGSKVPWLVLGGGLTGGTLGLGLQWWVNVMAYPLIIGGKPYFSLPAFIPVTFELTVLLAAFGAVFGMLGINRLPTFYHPVFRHSRFWKVTDDGFFLSIERTDPRFDVEKARAVLEAAGGQNVEVLEA